MTNTVDSVWRKVERRGEDECWPWTGRSRASLGYGRLDIGNVEGVYAHRAAYLSANPGTIPLRADRYSNQLVLHKCDNPACCNPRHLFLGSQEDNMRDKVVKGRTPKWGGENSPNVRLTNEQAAEVRRVRGYGVASSELARLFAVSKGCIKGICAGRHFKDA